MSEKCPFFEIDFNKEGREVINCDKLSFPWSQDEKGYFLIRILNDELECGFVNSKHKMTLVLHGKDPDKIIKEIAKRKLVNLTHIGYVASELMIAYECMINKKEYVQR
ncbi:hypothetical protein KY321_00575 [Candidatus Woesearchaeota archaeon]|nr:hypothetical protein [Candidatus Woesearchaeota archaeon]